MKNLMRVISVLLVFAAVILIIMCTFDINNYDFLVFCMKVLMVCSANIMPIISIALCAYCLERNDTNYVVRIIPIFMSIPILITIIMMLFETNAQWLQDAYDLFSKTFVSITALSFVLVIKPNNQITKITSYVSYGLILVNFILPLILESKDTVFNLFGSSYGGYSSIANGSSEFLLKMYYASIIAELFAIPLLYITNYAFSDKIELEAADIDYEAVKEDALNAANEQMNSIYNKNETQKEEIDRSASEKGLMNVNNQLGQDSNVGTVKKQATEMNVSGSSLDSLMPQSRGPIANAAPQTTTQEQPKEAPTAVQPTTPTTPPNVDIQEEMKRKMQQENVTQNVTQQNVQPTLQQTVDVQPQPSIQQTPVEPSVTPQQNVQQNNMQ